MISFWITNKISNCLGQQLPAHPVAVPVHCPPEGLYTFPHPQACDQYYLCRNGTLTHEFCPNGLAHAEKAAVYEFCAHLWNVDCTGKTVRKLNQNNYYCSKAFFPKTIICFLKTNCFLNSTTNQ